MGLKKKQIREVFRLAVFKRDRYCCVMCGKPGMDRQDENAHKKYHNVRELAILDAHHISDRTLMPAGGYIKENGASVCESCHVLAEQYHITGTPIPGYSPEDLYEKIGSSYEMAYEASLKLVQE